jgi:hypothetical protein
VAILFKIYKKKPNFKIQLVIMTFNNNNDVEYDYLFKILIIGDSGVGYVVDFHFIYISEYFHSLEKLRFYNVLHKIIFQMNM